MSDVVTALGGWSHGQGPLYQRLARALEAAIERGDLAAGTVLPPERELAAALSVSRSTVVAALERLKTRGRLEARQGSGTWVRPQRWQPSEGNRALVEALEGHAIIRDVGGRPAAPQAPATGVRPVGGPARRGEPMPALPGSAVEFTAAAVDCAPEVLAGWTAIPQAELAQWSEGHGYVPQGILPLRESVADRLSTIGLPTGPEQILITTGATQAILLAARLFLEPGAPVAIETPSYAGAIDVLYAAGGRLLPVAQDRSGVRVDQLHDLFVRAQPRLVYLVPDFSNPSGRILSERRRAEVARLAADLHVPVIEDLVQRDLWFDELPPPPIARFDPEAPVLTVGSLSKVFWGGLRIGWLRGDETTIARLARIKAVTDFGTPVLAQLVGAKLLAQIEEVGARRRAELAGRLGALAGALDRHLPDWQWERPAGGMCVWAQLPEPRADELARRAPDHGVTIVPGSTFAVGDERHDDRVRLPFVAEPAVLEEGVRRLALAWADVAERARRVPAHAVVV